MSALVHCWKCGKASQESVMFYFEGKPFHVLTCLPAEALRYIGEGCKAADAGGGDK